MQEQRYVDRYGATTFLISRPGFAVYLLLSGIDRMSANMTVGQAEIVRNQTELSAAHAVQTKSLSEVVDRLNSVEGFPTVSPTNPWIGGLLLFRLTYIAQPIRSTSNLPSPATPPSTLSSIHLGHELEEEASALLSDEVLESRTSRILMVYIREVWVRTYEQRSAGIRLTTNNYPGRDAAFS